MSHVFLLWHGIPYNVALKFAGILIFSAHLLNLSELELVEAGVTMRDVYLCT